ncbi:hypothetical protein BJV82DRAFT_613004 [Fennellomyces sp. T-0311]|nr:hypothetical protein BJV82DRAFT_613004 [Fennellomyces sp. T-0311]
MTDWLLWGILVNSFSVTNALPLRNTTSVHVWSRIRRVSFGSFLAMVHAFYSSARQHFKPPQERVFLLDICILKWR